MQSFIYLSCSFNGEFHKYISVYGVASLSKTMLLFTIHPPPLRMNCHVLQSSNRRPSSSAFHGVRWHNWLSFFKCEFSGEIYYNCRSSQGFMVP